jgi:hypothetical protein
MSTRGSSGISGRQAAMVIAVCLWIMAATLFLAPQ